MAATPYPAYRGLSQAHTSQARAGAAPPGKISGTVPVISPDGGYALSGLQGPLTGSYLAGPRRRSAAGQDIRHGTCNFAGWRLSPYPAYRVLSQAQTSQARASAAPPGKISGTVPVISPGGGYALPGLQGLSQAQTSQARVSAAPPGMRRFTSRLPDGYRTPPSPPPAPLR